MKKPTILCYFLPVLAIVLRTMFFLMVEEPRSSFLELFGVLAGALVFYAFPFVFWLCVCTALRPRRVYWHVGFIAANLALLVVGLMSFLPGDPSGLPMHWILYWPLAIALQLAFGIVAKAAVWLLPNNRFNSDAGKARAG